MGFRRIKTEHSGAKKGRGSFYGPKRIAKRVSNKIRRVRNRKESKQ